MIIFFIQRAKVSKLTNGSRFYSYFLTACKSSTQWEIIRQLRKTRLRCRVYRRTRILFTLNTSFWESLNLKINLALAWAVCFRLKRIFSMNWQLAFVNSRRNDLSCEFCFWFREESLRLGYQNALISRRYIILTTIEK
jgi:hypothetical protein